eukprot:TRINITY_DN2748_c0_g1_i1.p1 TRINITY_DN2748_c0_g1~~TRINITY_DN2748_c0_g1_i1.p1  ORF type:complete len:970 (-),score=221.52 TRINITY_DN2748_c0_g1_i1:1608-4475(-)
MRSATSSLLRCSARDRRRFAATVAAAAARKVAAVAAAPARRAQASAPLTAQASAATSGAAAAAARICGSDGAEAVSFRSDVRIEGVTLVTDEASALRALAELRRLADRVHAWDTECVGLEVGPSSTMSPVSHGRIVCATCFCGEDADFGSGPRLFVDNEGPAAGLLRKHFAEYFEDAGIAKVFHNYSFDAHLLRREGIILRGFHADTLHLARLYDTSLGGWEAEAQLKLQRLRAGSSGAEAATAGSEDAETRDRNAKRRPVLGVTLGGRSLESNAGVALEPPQPKAPAAKLPASKKTGYSLKQLARHFDLGGSTEETSPRAFMELFGADSTAAGRAHHSPEEFPRWVQYATEDAVLTHRLFSFLEAKLLERPWLTTVHGPKMADVLRNKDVAAELLRRRHSGSQMNTNRTTMDYYATYLRDFAVCLADLEHVGLGVDMGALEQIEEGANRDLDARKKDVIHLLGGLRDEHGRVLNPDLDLLNLRSPQQLQTLLYGGTASNKTTGETLEATRQFPAPRRQKKRSEEAAAEAQGRAKEARFELRSLGLEPLRKKKHHTKTGWPSVSAAVLRELAKEVVDGNPAGAGVQLERSCLGSNDVERVAQGLRHVGDIKRLTALISNFVMPLRQHGAATGRVHASWAFDTATGRLACRKPNLQNLPSEHQDIYRLRDAFRAPPGKVFIAADYSQLEMRVLAHMSGSRMMAQKLARGGDYHSEVCVEMFQHVADAVASGEVAVDASEAVASPMVAASKGDARAARPTVKQRFAEERSRAKAVNFAIIFGKEATSLAEDLNVTESDAEALMEAWFRNKPEVRKWKKQVLSESRLEGRALSLLGRWRMLPLLHSDDDRPESFMYRRRSERAAVNFAIQGSAADIVIAATIRVARNTRLRELGFQLVLQVHDEFVLEGPEEHAAEASAIVSDLMANPFREHSPDFQLILPLTVDVGVGRSLYSAKGN